MIVTAEGISGTLADGARANLEEVDQLRADGRLAAGKKNSKILKWTIETHSIAKQFLEVCLHKAYIVPHNVD
jgi:hypothetical protein